MHPSFYVPDGSCRWYRTPVLTVQYAIVQGDRRNIVVKRAFGRDESAGDGSDTKGI